MSKQIICELFTIKNILVLSGLSLGYMNNQCTQAPVPSVTVAHFSSQLPELLKFTRDNATSGCTIHVMPQQSWFSVFAGSFVIKWHTFLEKFTLKNVSLALISSALSLGALSYLLSAYVIYKVYSLAQTSTSWINWCSDDELLLDDEILYEKLAMHRSRRRHLQNKNLLTLHQEKLLLSEYLAIDQFLREYKVRQYFPGVTLNPRRTLKRLEKAYLLKTRRIEQMRALALSE